MNAPDRSPGSPQSPNPASSLLQGLLREKKAENRRISKVYDSDLRRISTYSNGADARDVQSSPIPSHVHGREDSLQADNSFGGRNASATKGMGMREMEQVRFGGVHTYKRLIISNSTYRKSASRISTSSSNCSIDGNEMKPSKQSWRHPRNCRRITRSCSLSMKTWSRSWSCETRPFRKLSTSSASWKPKSSRSMP